MCVCREKEREGVKKPNALLSKVSKERVGVRGEENSGMTDVDYINVFIKHHTCSSLFAGQLCIVNV